VNETAEFSSHDVMLFLPDDGFQPDLELGEEFLADSLFSPGDCVLSDVSLSDALDRRDLNLAERREFNLNEKHFNANDDKQVNFGSSLSSGSLHSDGDSYPNSPINDLEDSMCTEGILGKEDEPKACFKQEEGVRVKVEPDGGEAGAWQFFPPSAKLPRSAQDSFTQLPLETTDNRLQVSKWPATEPVTLPKVGGGEDGAKGGECYHFVPDQERAHQALPDQAGPVEGFPDQV